MLNLYPQYKEKINFRIFGVTCCLLALLFGHLNAQTVVSFANAGVGQTFTVPQGVTSIQVKAWGAAGGAYCCGTPYDNIGGGGGFASATIAVTPGETLTVNVGGNGTAAGGINGGGPSSGGAGGGGSTDLLRDTSYLIVAGGGGGAGNGAGGPGGGLIGGPSTVCSVGTQGGTQTSGGLVETCSGQAATNGSFHQGGMGLEGGGGGGWYGGGGGSCGCGGGGGSGHVTGTCTSLVSAPSGGYGYTGSAPGDTTDPNYNGTAGRGVVNATGYPGLLVIVYGDTSLGTPTLTGNLTPCGSTATTYTTNTGMSNYVWTVTGGTIKSGGGSGNSSITIQWNTAGTVSVSFNSCSSSSSTTTLNVTPVVAVAPTISISADPAGTICAGTAVTFTAAVTGGGTTPVYQWHLNNLNAGGDSAKFTVDTLRNGSYVYCVLTSNSPCVTSGSAISDTIIAHVNVVPATGNIMVASDTICAGDTVHLSITAINAAIQWQSSNTPTGFNNIAGADSANYAVAPGQLTYYRVIAANGICADTSAFVRLLVNPAPLSPVISSADSIICATDSSLILSSGNYATYLWSDGARTPYTYASQAGSYRLSVSDANGCTAVSNQQVVLVYAEPAGPYFVIEGDSLSSFGGFSYQWYFNDVAITGATGAAYVTNCVAGNYGVQLTDTNGCTIRSEDIMLACAGISEMIKNTGLSVYPDPFTNIIYVKANAAIKQVELYDVAGCLAYSNAISEVAGGQFSIEVSTLPAGIYFVKVQAGGNEYVTKLVKL